VIPEGIVFQSAGADVSPEITAGQREQKRAAKLGKFKETSLCSKTLAGNGQKFIFV
jgi:hypothetical protein